MIHANRIVDDPVSFFLRVVVYCSRETIDDALRHLSRGDWPVLKSVKKDLLTRVSDIPRKKVEWLWEPYLPRGFVTVLAGPKWGGKTWVTMSIVEALTRGGGFPGSDLTFAPINCGYISSEDPEDCVLRPRLEDIGADLDRVYVHYGAMPMDQLIVALRHQIVKFDLEFIAIDPLLSFLPTNKRSISSEDMRAVLDPVGELAKEFECVIMLPTHLAKQPYAEALDRISGSAQIAAQSRSILFVDKDPERQDPHRRVLVHAGSNLGETGDSWAYTIEGGQFEWEPTPVNLDATQLFGNPSSSSSSMPKTGATAVALEIITDLCSDDYYPTADVFAAGKERGISIRTLQKVAEKLVQKRREGVGTKTQKVFWMLKKDKSKSNGKPNSSSSPKEIAEEEKVG